MNQIKSNLRLQLQNNRRKRRMYVTRQAILPGLCPNNAGGG